MTTDEAINEAIKRARVLSHAQTVDCIAACYEQLGLVTLADSIRALRAQVADLTRERDEARAEVSTVLAERDAAVSIATQMERELDRLMSERARLAVCCERCASMAGGCTRGGCECPTRARRGAMANGSATHTECCPRCNTDWRRLRDLYADFLRDVAEAVGVPACRDPAMLVAQVKRALAAESKLTQLAALARREHNSECSAVVGSFGIDNRGVDFCCVCNTDVTYDSERQHIACATCDCGAVEHNAEVDRVLAGKVSP